ncbi:MAG TPA: M14 metallopeptidase family protein [Opitutaceae bacterium]
MLTAAEPRITPAKDQIGFSIGDDYMIANYTQISALLQKWDSESDRMTVVSIGTTEEGRNQLMAIITSPENHAKLETYRDMSTKLARARISEDEARKFSKEGKAIVWIDGGLHATETVNAQSLTEMVYQMISKTDEETMRFLNDVVLLMPVPNPDGVELVANWYMRNPDPKARTLNALPRLYQKYIGHDNNRDSIMHNMIETANQNKVLYVQWNPQIMHNVHQTGPAGQVIYIPPFRDPFNFDFDAYIPIGIQAVSTHMHARLVEQGMGGSAMRSAAPYSTWFNGGMRTAGYFRNNIGILTEVIGGPTPMTIPLLPDKQLPRADWPLPIKPRQFHYRDAINYMIEVERAVLDYASRNREKVLYNIYAMGRRSIERGSKDTWKMTPKRIDALKAAGAASAQAAGPQAMGGAAVVGGGGQAVNGDLYGKVLEDPAFRDPRGYIIPADQDDYPTVIKFIQVLQKGGIEVHKATSSFTVAGKTYAAGSYIVQSAQAFRPAVMDTFEAQDHPMDFAYPGGPPVRPYDITGWTVARQMGIQYDRIMEGFTGPFQPIGFELEKPAAANISGPANAAGWLVSHKINDAFILTNRLLKANAEVFWLKQEQTVEGKALGTGTLWIPASAAAKPIVERAARELGIAAHGVAAAPKGEAFKLKPIRIGLVDTYGGSMPSGWTRWILEKFEFNFEVVFPQVLDAGNLKANFDVIVFPSGTFSEGRGGRGGGRGGFGPSPDMIPEEFRSMLGSVTVARSVPPLKAFVEAGGTVVAVGSAASIGQSMGLPVVDHLVEKGPDGVERRLAAEKFYIPGSVLHASFDNTVPLAYGMPSKGYIFFDDSPVFNRPADTSTVHASKVAWFEGKQALYSGWAVGQEYLDGGELATEASVGAGKLVLLGLEATFRATPHGTYKLFFNGLYYGSATPTTL